MQYSDISVALVLPLQFESKYGLVKTLLTHEGGTQDVMVAQYPRFEHNRTSMVFMEIEATNHGQLAKGN